MQEDKPLLQEETHGSEEKREEASGEARSESQAWQEKIEFNRLIEEPPLLPIKSEAHRLVGMFYDALISNPRLLGEVARSSRAIKRRERASKKRAKKLTPGPNLISHKEKKKIGSKVGVYTYITVENMEWLESLTKAKQHSLTTVVNTCFNVLREKGWKGDEIDSIPHAPKKLVKELETQKEYFENVSKS